MYRQGLTVRQIAELCSVVQGTVDRHIRLQKQRDPSLYAEHEKNVPPVKSRPISAIWLANLEAMKQFHEHHGLYPTSKNPDQDARRLARWLTNQRARLDAGRLSQEKQERMAALPGWEDSQRQRIDAERWERRLEEVRVFRAEHLRWPRHRKSGSEHERVLGVWLHSRRQEAINGRMNEHHRTTLDAMSPEWNTWNASRSKLNG